MRTLSSTSSLLSSSKKRVSTLALWLALCLQLFAADLPTPADGVVTFNGFTSRTSGNVVTYSIPLSGYPSTLEVNLRGGDGGFAQSGRAANPTNQASKGGGGILGAAQFSIHPSNSGALRPGGEIRLIPGNKGYDRQSGIYAHAASGGGGGSGVLYRGPNNGDDWQPLIIAGGGGGAYASTVTGNRAANRNGGNGQATENGQPQSATKFAGGTSGNGGKAGSGFGGGGGGWISGGEQSGGREGYSAGGSGGEMSINTNKGAHGGFGCGGGGDGGKTTNVTSLGMTGGGGGGYSGGGGGANTHGGGGGGSYIVSQSSGGITPIAQSTSWTPRVAGLKQHGFVSIKTAGIGTGSVLPTISGSLAVTVEFSSSQPYVDSGISAKDFLGQSIALNITSGSVDRSASGQYDLKYEATDTFGQKVTATRTVTVKPGSYRPTFTLPAAINISQAGQQSPQAATNFNANWLGDGDSFESLVRYEIRGNSNPSLLMGEPTIANNGKLTITPNGTTAGITTLTIVAIDNGPDPTVVKSHEKTVDLRINMAPSAGQFLVNSNPYVFSSSTNYSEDSSSLIAGIVKSIDTDNPQDLYYQLGGADNGLFTLGQNDGILRFKTQPNYETPNDHGQNRAYDLQIITNDPSSDANVGNRIVSDVTVHLLDVNEPPSEPTLTSNSIAENTTTVGILNSSDPDLTNNTVSFSIVEHPSSDWGHFQISNVNSQSRLEFVNAPDFETPADIDELNDYSVIVRATSNEQSEVQTFTVYVTNAEELFTTPTLTNNTVLENTKDVGLVQSIDPDGTDVLFQLSEAHGLDWQLFNLDSSSGALAFKVAPDYEALIEGEGDATFSITVVATSGGDSLSQTFTIAVTDVDEAPTTPALKEGSDSNIVENQTEVGFIESSDPDGTAVSYSISGELGLDSDKFEIHPISGLLSMKSAPDYENPGYNEEVPVYEVCVVATSNGQSTLGFFEVVVTDVDENPTAPVFEDVADSNVEENQTTVGRVISTAGGLPVSYAISSTEGDDSSLFQIAPNTGDLSFTTAPDFEQPSDKNTDNVYNIYVEASANGLTTGSTLSITVTGANEPPSAPEIDNIRVDENVRFVGTATSTDPEGTAVTFSIAPSPDAASFSVQSTYGYLSFNFDPDFETPADQGEDNVYEVAIRASSNGQELISTFFITVDAIDENPTQPTIDNSIVIEGSSFVGTVSSEDPEGETVTFSLTDQKDSHLFTIDPSNGQLSFLAPPDYEIPLDQYSSNNYKVQVKVTANELSSYETFRVQVRKEWFGSVSEFRATYGLAADGSDDLGDLSSNGISNIYYHLFGMGDPNDPSQQTQIVSNSLAIPGMPRVVVNSDQTTSVFYTTRIKGGSYWIQPQFSIDLTNWHLYQAPWIDADPEFQPNSYTEMSIGEDHKVIELRFYTAPEINDPNTPDYPNLFFKIQADRS